MFPPSLLLYLPPPLSSALFPPSKLSLLVVNVPAPPPPALLSQHIPTILSFLPVFLPLTQYTCTLPDFTALHHTSCTLSLLNYSTLLLAFYLFLIFFCLSFPSTLHLVGFFLSTTRVDRLKSPYFTLCWTHPGLPLSHSFLSYLHLPFPAALPCWSSLPALPCWTFPATLPCWPSLCWPSPAGPSLEPSLCWPSPVALLSSPSPRRPIDTVDWGEIAPPAKPISQPSILLFLLHFSAYFPPPEERPLLLLLPTRILFHFSPG